MIWRLLPFGLVALLVAGSLVSDFLAGRLAQISKGRLTGNDPKAKWLKGSENFARMDEPRTMSRLGEDRNGKAAAPGDSQIVSMNR